MLQSQAFLVVAALLASAGFTRSVHGEEVMPSGFFWLTTQFREGHDECLEGNRVDGSAKDGAAFMDKKQDVTGQLWAAIPEGDGYFRLTTKALMEHDEFLEGNQLDGSEKDGAAFMDKKQDVSGQLWKAIPEGDGYFRLTTKFREEHDECLEGNQFDSSVKNGCAFMDKKQDVSGQLWKAIPAESASR
ncbi:MAG: hypothetical protein ACRCT8_15325 [Lacipirellulaceae bacterium]